eukprot:TRINITY_DN4306_c0_g2_i1.p1 TRINITY_DN4306_c0_g2~~TRINITY_DN4306_c0_g2_i1.p1  ORF type:complete len:599 (-),score=60.60 TRINITY_DN4306_c0_g2_i1:291-2087(-)
MLRRSVSAMCLALPGAVQMIGAETVEDLSGGHCRVGLLDLRSGTNSGQYGRQDSVVPLTLSNQLNRSVAVYVADPAEEDASPFAPAAQAILSKSQNISVSVVSGELLQFRDARTGSLMCELPIIEQYVSSSPSATIQLANDASFCNLNAQHQKPCADHRCVVTPKTFSISKYYRKEVPGFYQRLKDYGWKELPLVADKKGLRVSRRVQLGVLESYSPLWHVDKDCCGKKTAMFEGTRFAPILNQTMLPFTVAAAAEQAGKPVPSYLVRSFVMSRVDHRLTLFHEACKEDLESGPKRWIMKPHSDEDTAGADMKIIFNKEIWELLSAGPREYQRFCLKPWPSQYVHQPLPDSQRKKLLVQDFVSDFMPWPGSRSESGRRWQLRAFMLLTELHPPTLHFIDAVAFKGRPLSNTADMQASNATNSSATERQVEFAHDRDHIFPLPEVQYMYDTLDPEANVSSTWASEVMPKSVCNIASDLMSAVATNIVPSSIGRNRYSFFALDFLVGANMTLKLMQTQQSPNLTFEGLKPCVGRVYATCDVYRHMSHSIVDLLLRHYDLEPKAVAPRVRSCPVRTPVVSLRKGQRRFGDRFNIFGAKKRT